MKNLPPASVSPAAISSLWVSVGAMEVLLVGARARRLVVKGIPYVDLIAVKNLGLTKFLSYLCSRAAGRTQNHLRPVPDSTRWEATAGQEEEQYMLLDTWALTHSKQDQIGRRLEEGEEEE